MNGFMSSGDLQAFPDTPFILAELHAAHSELIHRDPPAMSHIIEITPPAADTVYLPLSGGRTARLVIGVASDPLPTPHERPEIHPPSALDLEEIGKALDQRAWHFSKSLTPFAHE
jgi:hypothetical protein